MANSTVKMRPANMNSTAEVEDHSLEVIEGRFTDIVWVCVYCGKRGVDTEVFEDEPCDN